MDQRIMCFLEEHKERFWQGQHRGYAFSHSLAMHGPADLVAMPLLTISTVPYPDGIPHP